MNSTRLPQARVLIVDTDIRLVRSIRNSLESAGYRAAAAMDVSSLSSILALEEPQLILLDLSMPDIDGYEILRRIREHSTTPIILFAAGDKESDKVRGLNLGADDYICKPFGMNELLARVNAVLRRAGWPKENDAVPVFASGDISIDFGAHQVVARGREVDLSAKEYKLLVELVKHAGQVVLHEDLLSSVWGPSYREETSYLRVYIRHLRRKLESDPGNPRYVLSKFGIGYMFARATVE
ncbi:MAG: response regulator transcription factor [Dehalococcoidia bacterium]|nr:response regulator transcription factor [Dehalococcoidia bacterium]